MTKYQASTRFRFFVREIYVSKMNWGALCTPKISTVNQLRFLLKNFYDPHLLTDAVILLLSSHKQLQFCIEIDSSFVFLE